MPYLLCLFAFNIGYVMLSVMARNARMLEAQRKIAIEKPKHLRLVKG